MENGKKKIDMEDIEKIAKATGKDKMEIFQKLNGMTIGNTISNAHGNRKVVSTNEDDWYKLLIEEKDKRITEKENINQEQKRHIVYLEDKLKNVGLL